MKASDNPSGQVTDIALEDTVEASWGIVNLLYAWSGLQAAWRGEAGFRNHVFGAFAMTTTLVVIQPEAIWWALAFLSSAMLMALELLNSAIERMIDHVDGRIHPEIKLIKDMAAAAVVVASIGVLLLGVAMIVDTVA